MKKVKIYLRAGIGLLVLFMIAAYIMTDIQTRHIYNDMQINYTSASIKLINDINRAAESPFTDDWRLTDLMFAVNYSICGTGQQWSNMNMYSSILLLDKNKEVITRSGDFLQCSSFVDQDGRKNYLMIPLNKYCTNEQLDRIYDELYNRHQGTGNFVQGNISGYFDKWGFVPRKISINNKDQKNNLTLEFDNNSNDNILLDSWNEDSATLWVQGFGQQNRALTEKDRAIIKECEAAGFIELCKLPADGNGTGTGGAGYAQFKVREAIPVKINGETCYLVIGAQGFPQRDAIVSLMPIYIFLFILMMILFIMVSRSFIKIYKQQIELETTRQDLINAVAHELKTPLGVIRSFCEVLKEKINEEKKEHYLDVIQNETGRMKEMVSDMLALSQLESGVGLTRQNNSLNLIVEQVLAQYQELITNKSITTTIVSSDSCVINCDKRLMEQVISNFLSNAVRHTPEQGNIKISITDNNGKVSFAIENNGQRIPDDKIKYIWDAYYKTDTARSNPKGTGLGLSIVKTILTAHGYSYGVENIESGVIFWFAVPKANNTLR